MCESEITLAHETDGRWIAEIESVPGAMAYGVTKEEAVEKVIALATAIGESHDAA